MYANYNDKDTEMYNVKCKWKIWIQEEAEQL